MHDLQEFYIALDWKYEIRVLFFFIKHVATKTGK